MIKLTWYESFSVSMAISFLSMLSATASAKTGGSVALSLWEQIAIGTALSFLMALGSQTTNATEQSALQSTVQFLQGMMSGGNVEVAGLQSAVAFLQKLMSGQVAAA
jgi:hypothetical protein